MWRELVKGDWAAGGRISLPLLLGREERLVVCGARGLVVKQPFRGAGGVLEG